MNKDAATSNKNISEEFIKHGNALFRYAVARVGDRHTAEDLVQDTLVTAVTKHTNFAGRSTLRTWLTGILRHKILDHYRWRQRHPHNQAQDFETEKDKIENALFTKGGVWRNNPNQGLEALDQGPANALERSQLRAALQFCIDRLPDKLHKIFILREFEALETEQISKALEISESSVAVFLYRARQQLRLCLQSRWLEL